MKRLLSGLSLALALGAVTEVAAEPVELEVLYAWASHARFHDPLAEDFMAGNPGITISYRAAAPNYDDAVQMLIRQKLADQIPDIHYVGYNLLREVAARGLATPLDDLVGKEDMAALGYLDNVLELGQIDGIQYGIPLSMSTMVVYFNADLVVQAGGDPDNMPDNWDDFIALSGRIAALGDDIWGMYYQVGAEDWTTQNLIMNLGGTVMNDALTEVTLDGPAGQAAVSLFRRFHDEGGQPAITKREAGQMFVAGKLGFYPASPSGIRSFGDQIGDRFVFRTAPLPLAGPESTFATGGMAAIILTNDPERRAAAWDFVKYGTGPAGQNTVVRNTGYMPTNTLALGDEYLGNFYEENPNYYTSVTQIPRSRPTFSWPANGLEIGATIKNNMESIAAGADPQDTLEKMADEVRALLR